MVHSFTGENKHSINETYKHSHVIYNNAHKKLYENNFCSYRVCEI